ncbi:MAG: fibronectin type III-like domain-contianing protein [Anaeromyxobacteraceae bacterium]
MRVDPWVTGVDALLMAWFGGMSEGTALGELVFGDLNPSGRLVQSFPVAEADLPPFPNTTPEDVAVGYFHGYRWLDRGGITPRYPFGFGQSYTTFAYSNLSVKSPVVADDGEVVLTVDVTNTGPVTGTDVVQAYVSYPGSAVAGAWGRPAQELKAFARVAEIAPGETRPVSLSIRAEDLAWWDAGAGAMRVEKLAYAVRVGASADASDPRSLHATFTVR